MNDNLSGSSSTRSTNNTCDLMVEAHAPGLWGIEEVTGLLSYALPRLQLQLAMIFFLTQSLHFCLRRFNLPRITSEIMAGIILGPSALGKIKFFNHVFLPEEGDIYLDFLSKIGYIFYIFLSGVKMNPRLVATTGAATMSAWTIGILASLIAFSGGMCLALLSEQILMPDQLAASKSIIAVQNIYAFPVIFSLLVDLKIMNSELGRLALTSTLISDLVSNVLGSVASNIRIGFAGWMNGVSALNVMLMVIAICVVVVPIQPISRWIIHQTQEGRPINRVYVITLSAAVLISAILTDNTGLLYQHGPFMLGLALPDGPPLGSTLVQKLETLVCGLFAPLLATYCTLKIDIFLVYNLMFRKKQFLLVTLSLVIKFVAIVSPAIMSKLPIKDAFALAFIMSTQGIVQLAFYFNTYISQTFDDETFAMATVSLMVIASVMQVCAKSLYDHSRMYAGYQKRDIQHLSYNAELRVLVSSQRADDALAVKRILEMSFPSKDCPLAVYALTLVELVGRAHPLLIDHQLGQKSAVVGPHMEKILDIFLSFREQYMGMVSVQMFTSMSLPRFMHDDVCALAFDKKTSMIILPFHRKWNTQGKMISENKSVRSMNCNVLEMAPCSVAILVDRHRIKTSSVPSSTYNVAIVFMGGNDDREALAYGKRMARSLGFHLTIIRFIPLDTEVENQWDVVMDVEVLKETRLQSAHQDNIVYKEEKVKDGPETALRIHEMEDNYDLIMVGRRHRKDMPQLLGLDEWNDLPELGPIGDMLASAEINKPLSVLIIQHQILRRK